MNLFKQIKILDTKNYTNDAILSEKIKEKMRFSKRNAL